MELTITPGVDTGRFEDNWLVVASSLTDDKIHDVRISVRDGFTFDYQPNVPIQVRSGGETHHSVTDEAGLSSFRILPAEVMIVNVDLPPNNSEA